MRALRSIVARWMPAASPGEAEGEDAATGGLVLPRFLRRPVRALIRADARLPRHVGVKGAGAFLMTTAIAGMLIGGHSGTVVAAITTWSGLGIDEVKITGQSETSELDVLDQLAIGTFPSLVTFDVDAAKARVESLPWVEQATIRKLYPDTLQVRIAERTPYAIWQHDTHVSLIDAEGKVISDDVGDRYSDLPLVVGAGANTRVEEFVALVDGFPALKPRIKAGVRIFDRRWDVALTDGIEILLPQDDPSGALQRIVELDSASGLLSRDIAAVDLRAPDRLVVRLSERGKLARDAMLKEREKSVRRGGANT